MRGMKKDNKIKVKNNNNVIEDQTVVKRYYSCNAETQPGMKVLVHFTGNSLEYTKILILRIRVFLSPRIFS